MAQTSRRRFLSQLAAGQSQGGAPGSRRRRSLKDLRQALRGVHSYLPTPFHANLEINLEGMRQNAAFYSRVGVQPLILVVAAGLGELFSLGFEEHREMVAAVACLAPEDCRAFWEKGTAGNLAEMNRILEQRISPMAAVRSLRPGYSAAGIKVALETLGRAGGPTRPPMGQVAAEDRPRIEAIVRRHAET